MANEINVAEALEKIKGSSVRIRSDGLADLRHILRNNKNYNHVDDHSFHAIFEPLFETTVSEQSTYLKSKTFTTRNAAESRLSACASALRVSVEAGVSLIRLKTVKSVLDHVLDTLLLPNGQLCEPIALDYAKTIATLLGHQAHVEHLPQSRREEIMLFCIARINQVVTDLDEDDTEPGTENFSVNATINGLSHRSSRSQVKDSGDSQGGRSVSKQVAEQMVTCLASLTATLQARGARATSAIPWALIEFLKKGNQSHLDAFAGLNNIIAWTRTEDIALCRKLATPIARLIRVYWPRKSASASRTEMLKTLLYLQPYITSLIRNGDITMRSELRGLLDAMRVEYGKRQDKDQMHLEDLRLTTSLGYSERYFQIANGIFELRGGNTRAEANWVMVHLMATFCNLLTEDDSEREHEDEEDDINPRPRKRQRVESELDRVVGLSSSSDVHMRACALQVFAFAAQQKPLSSRRITLALDSLSTSSAENSSSVASWALLALASLASQVNSSNKGLANRWTAVWQIANRAMSNTATCRAACHLLLVIVSAELISHQQVIEFSQTIAESIALNGPAALGESVLQLLGHMLEVTRNSNPGSASRTAENVLGWLFRSFVSSKFDDKSYAGMHNLFDPGDIVTLIRRCLSQPVQLTPAQSYPVWGSLGHAWVSCEDEAELLRYLLLTPEAPRVLSNLLKISQPSQLSTSTSASCESIVLNTLLTELHRTQDIWSQVVQEKPRSISLDVFSFFCSVISIAACVAFCHPFRDVRQQQQLQKQVKALLTSLTGFVPGRNCAQDQVDALLMVFSTSCSGLTPRATAPRRHDCEQHLCNTIHRICTSRRANEQIVLGDDEEAMNMETEYESQNSRRDDNTAGDTSMRTELATTMSIQSLRASVAMYAALTSDQVQHPASEEDSATTSSSAMDYIRSLSPESIISSRLVVTRLQDVGVDLSTVDAERLLDHCIKTIFSAYSFERSEPAMGVVVDILSSIMPLWVAKENKELFGLGLDLYEWYTTTALPNGLLSPRVQGRVATLLLQLCNLDPDYSSDEEEVASVRTSLFEFLKKGCVAVLFQLSASISSIFGLHVLANHEAMFDDLQESLPIDTGWLEGIAMRLLFFSRLASAWHSLLRPCVYYMFETAAGVRTSSEHAARSMSELASTLKFHSSRDLFHIFAPQLLYTWFDQKREVAKLPFVVFGYDSLDALIIHNQAELTAQLLVKGNDDGLEAVMSATSSTNVELYVRSFAKCEAYCLIQDAAHRPAEGKDSTEARLRGVLTKERHSELIMACSPVIMAQFYISVYQDDVQDAWLERRKGYHAAAQANTEMKGFSASDRALPPVQQPSLRARVLCDHIDRLCRRTGYNPVEPLDASSFSTVARILVDSIDPALGPLQACVVIRKLRLLISLSGAVVLSEFPLEMLIHTLRPFSSDGQCADDVIGILQYLFHHGQDHLKTNLPFLFGTATLMILRMKKHAGSRQDSTTQESQHKQTVQKMQVFQAWLVGYLRQCLPSDRSSVPHAYASLTKALDRVHLPGNGRKSTAESSLILLLIGKDGVSALPLQQADRNEALVLLADSFEPPTSGSEDCLEDAFECTRVVKKLWAVMQIPKLSDSFIAWTASAIGSAYAYDGTRPTREPDQTGHKRSTVSRKDLGSTTSQAAIAQRLSDMLYSSDRRQASIADYTLRSIAQTFTTDQDEALDFQQLLPSKTVATVWPGTFGYVPDLASSDSIEDGVMHDLSSVLTASRDEPLHKWIQDVSTTLCDHAPLLPILPALKIALRSDATLAYDILPYMTHILLVHNAKSKQSLRTDLSAAAAALFARSDEIACPKQKYMLNLLLYLLKQRLPGETTEIDRLRWLEVDWLQAARAADRCGQSTTALMFAESASQPQQGSRRSSSRASLSQVPLSSMPQDLLLSIFKTLDEPDSFYGVEQPASLTSVLERLDYEGDGHKSLMFRSAQTDTDVRRSGQTGAENGQGIIQSLSTLNLDSVSFALLSNGFGSANSAKELMNSAQRLQRWDVAVPSELTHDATSSCFLAFKELSRATDRDAASTLIGGLIVKHAMSTTDHLADRPSTEWLSGLAVLSEVDSLLKSADRNDLRLHWEELQSRRDWMKLVPFSDFRLIVSGRQTLFNVIAANSTLSAPFGLREVKSIEIESLIELSSIAREHGQLQEALSASNQLGEVVARSKDLGINADVAAMSETASVLWEANEAVSSVQMIRDALSILDSGHEDTSIGRSGLLAQLAHQLAEARLEKPGDILNKYLRPAISHLQDRTTGAEAGKVFHEFATFCDTQLANPSNTEDISRITKLRQRKREEYENLDQMQKGSKRSNGGNDYRKARDAAKNWHSIYDAEYVRLRRIQNTFLQQSLQNYLLALRASDKYDLSVLRFFALWLENSDTQIAGDVVGKHLAEVPSWKFVVLMNQLMSRLENENTPFQIALKALAVRICSEHPYHSLHHLYASSRKPVSKDPAAVSRWEVANNIGQQVQSHKSVAQLLVNVFKANGMYNQFAFVKFDDHVAYPTVVQEVPVAVQVARAVPGLQVPPATIDVTLRRDGVYKDVPVITRFRSTIKIMGGQSHPKRLIAIGSDGREYVQLFKGSKDDLRQDAIMEQVFGEVSKMLRNHKTTRQRDLRVRTYNVIPLSNTSGVIEAVPNSISLVDYLGPAHSRYYPHDMKGNTARDKIKALENHSTEARIKEYRKICEHLHPVMRHFFFERFKVPDEWFAKRTAYTRTTAAISILGHVLGLGDRHCGNVMLDEKTGEIVHIDLGIAFEAGRILPVPELIPFRLSRDVVDGMGVTKTEGVFRRCCEFTLDALREDKDRIMTLLNVLRYDPLYEWTVSTTRAKQMQDQSDGGTVDGEEASSRKEGQEAGEADRALSIVEKKLSQAMSTAATVNELIQQATDERNLGTLFAGWSAYY